MPFVRGFLHIRRGGHPDQGLPGGGEGPDQGLPGGEYPDQGLPDGGLGIWGGGTLPHPDHGLPAPPPGIWPPPTGNHPIQPLPPGSTVPPGTIWPPPGYPAHPIAPGGGGEHPDQGLPGSPGRPDNSLPSQKFWIVAGIPGVGWRYVCVDPSLTVDNTLPAPPQAQPKA